MPGADTAVYPVIDPKKFSLVPRPWRALITALAKS